MATQRTAAGRRTAVIGVIAVIVIAAAVLTFESQGNPGASTTLSPNSGGSSSLPATQSTTTNSTTTATTLSPNPGGSSSVTSEQCTISAESTGFFLHLVTDSTNASVARVSVLVTPVIECGGDSVDNALARTYTTNGSGWAVISSPEVGGDYYLIYSLEYSGHDYNFRISWEPQAGTFTTIHLPSGNVYTVYRYPTTCNLTCTY